MDETDYTLGQFEEGGFVDVERIQTCMDALGISISSETLEKLRAEYADGKVPKEKVKELVASERSNVKTFDEYLEMISFLDTGDQEEPSITKHELKKILTGFGRNKMSEEQFNS